jgi:uncharacterized membrane protein YhaH (DUF805 family)
MIGSFRHNLTRLFQLGGRSSPAQFWPYMIVMILLQIMATAIPASWWFSQTFANMQRFAAEHPDQATVTQGPGSYSVEINGYHPELTGGMQQFAIGAAVILIIFLLLTGPAMVRRLHDSNRSGLWLLPTLVTLVIALAGTPLLVNGGLNGAEPSLFLFGLLLLNNLVYLSSLLVMLLLLIADGTPGPNRYGTRSPD